MDKHRICTRCGHACHCDQVECSKCANDVCTHCDCTPSSNIGTDARPWPGIDSGLENYN